MPVSVLRYNLRDCSHVAAQGENQTVGIIALFIRVFLFYDMQFLFFFSFSVGRNESRRGRIPVR